VDEKIFAFMNEKTEQDEQAEISGIASLLDDLRA
jgi:hypothetical protein